MSTTPYYDLCNPWIKNLHPYIPGRSEAEIIREIGLPAEQILKLNSNENLWGSSPKVAQIFNGVNGFTPSYYPDGNGFNLKQALAEHHKIDIQQITLGNGSNDVLDIIGRVFLRPTNSAIYSQYSFIVYALTTQTQGARSIVVEAKDYGHNLSAMANAVESDSAVLFIANPNNPTGTFNHPQQLRSLLDSVSQQVIVVLDEAYIEYIPDEQGYQSIDWLQEYPNLIIVRTFSKFYGLAGLRVGYAISHPDIADLLNRARQPFNTNHVAQQAARLALEDKLFQQQVRKEFFHAKQQLEQELEKLQLEYIPSTANFITVRFADPQAIVEHLTKQGILVRPVANYHMPNHLRITIGKPEHNQRLVNALGNIL